LVVPVEAVIGFPRRRAFHLLPGDIGAVAIEAGVVLQRVPRDRVEVLPHAEEAAEAHDRVGDPPGYALDHQVVDLPDVLAVRAVDLGALLLVAGDQLDLPDGGGLGGVHGRTPWRLSRRNSVLRFGKLRASAEPLAHLVDAVPGV